VLITITSKGVGALQFTPSITTLHAQFDAKQRAQGQFAELIS
jgi:hypothetical protein